MTVEVLEKDGKRYVDSLRDGPLEVKRGLPGEVRFCARCVISNQRPSSSVEHRNRPDSTRRFIEFDAEGVCSACRVAELKDREIDWQERARELEALCDKYRSRNGSHDCIVPGSGGKDSVFAGDLLRQKYGMHPLTVTWAPHMYTDVGWRNFQRWVHVGGFNNYLFTPDGQVHRKLTQFAYRELLHPFQPFVIGQKNFAPKLAARFAIPLVFYGEHEADYGSPIAESYSHLQDTKYYAQARGDDAPLYFGGVALEELPEHGIETGQMDLYLPAAIEDLVKVGVEVHYLGYYVKWVPQECYYHSVESTGFEANTERTEGTYSKYSSIDDKVDPFHYWTIFVKFGIGRATYDAAQEIRNHHIEREEGVRLVHKYDGELPRKYLPDFLEYLDMEEAEFFKIADGYRSPHLWRKTADGWQLRHRVRQLDQMGEPAAGGR